MCRRESPTVASATKATRVSTAIDGRGLWPAGGSAADMGSVAFLRVVSPSATVSQATPDRPATQVDRMLPDKVKAMKRSADMTRQCV